MPIEAGDKVNRLTMNGKPMKTSNGTGLIQGTVIKVTGDTARVKWIRRGINDPAETYDHLDSLRKVGGY